MTDALLGTGVTVVNEAKCPHAAYIPAGQREDPGANIGQRMIWVGEVQWSIVSSHKTFPRRRLESRKPNKAQEWATRISGKRTFQKEGTTNMNPPKEASVEERKEGITGSWTTGKSTSSILILYRIPCRNKPYLLIPLLTYIQVISSYSQSQAMMPTLRCLLCIYREVELQITMNAHLQLCYMLSNYSPPGLF